MAYISIRTMVKEMFFDLTQGKRTRENWIDGQFVIDNLQRFYYRSYFVDRYNEWLAGKKTSREIFRDLANALATRMYNDDARRAARIIRGFLHA